MTQNSSAASNNGQPSSSAASKKGGKNGKPEKNLYEPYETPTWFWVSLRAVARVLFAIIFNIHLRGRQNLPKEGPFIVAANHLSWMDVPFIPAYMSRKVVFMAKEELFQGKIGWLVRLLGAIPVKRGEADRQSLRAAETLLKAGKVFVIFPEGTRSRSRMMAKGHVGLGMIALRSGVPVVPVAIWGSEYSFKKFRPRITICYGQPVILEPKLHARISTKLPTRLCGASQPCCRPNTGASMLICR